jgi:hypothetical protein
MEISIADAAYIAGLFDADGSLQYKQYMKKRGKDKKAYPTWQIQMEISMTDKFVIQWVHETLGVGTFAKKPPGKGQLGKKMQYRWRCGFRDALYVSKLLWSEAKVKLHKIEQVIDHYEPRAQELGDNIIDLETEREIRRI